MLLRGEFMNRDKLIKLLTTLGIIAFMIGAVQLLKYLLEKTW